MEYYLPFTLIATLAESNSTAVDPVQQTGQLEQNEKKPEPAEEQPKQAEEQSGQAGEEPGPAEEQSKQAEEQPGQAGKQTCVRQGPLLLNTDIGRSLHKAST